MKNIQQDISADGQPVSSMQIAELERLGSEYSDIVTVLRTLVVEDEKINKCRYKED